MGEVYYGIHEEIAEMLAKKHGLRTFVETGTWHGDSARWASARFERVITIEIIEEYFLRNDFGLYPNVCAYNDDSRAIMPLVIATVATPTLFWLDAHWTGHPDYKEEYGKCAVIEEIETINKSRIEGHAIMVDDVRLFPSLMRVEPSEVIDLLSNKGARKVTIKDDVFYAEPKGD